MNNAEILSHVIIVVDGKAVPALEYIQLANLRRYQELNSILNRKEEGDVNND